MRPETDCLPNYREFYRGEIIVIGAMCFKTFKGFGMKRCAVVIVLRQWALACCSLCKKMCSDVSCINSFLK